jgi:hypothetical protein
MRWLRQPRPDPASATPTTVTTRCGWSQQARRCFHPRCPPAVSVRTAGRVSAPLNERGSGWACTIKTCMSALRPAGEKDHAGLVERVEVNEARAVRPLPPHEDWQVEFARLLDSGLDVGLEADVEDAFATGV